jgi:spermidine synthase
LPLLGSQGAYTFVVVLNLAIFALLLASQPELRGDRRLIREGAMVVVFVIAACAMLGKDYLRQALTRFSGAEVLAFRENQDASFVVLGYDSEHTGPYEQLVVNGTSYANNLPPGRRYMGTLGHLPALIHPDPLTALVISIGTGTTVGSLTLHSGIEQIWAVDIAREVFDLAPLFLPLNHRFTESRKVRTVVADGRHFLLGTKRGFDVLTFEPPPPLEAGVVNLYSREFYRLAKLHMNTGGVLCQWIPLDTGFEILPRMMIGTMLAEFRHASLWIPNRMEAAIIASMAPLQIDTRVVRDRMSAAVVREDMQAYSLGELEQLLATFVTADAALASYVGNAPTVTDDQPRIEYFSHYSPKRDIRFADILPHRTRVQNHLIGQSVDLGRLHLCEEVIEHIWSEYEATRMG